MASRPIYILHGWSVSPDVEAHWQPFRQCLHKLGLATHFLALPGFAGHELEQAWSLDLYVEWVLAQLPPRQAVILIGHSFGGQLAVRLTARHPERVAQLILISASGIRSQDWLAKVKRGTWQRLAKWGRAFSHSKRARYLLYGLIGERDYLQASPVMRATMSQVLSADTQDDAARVTRPTLIIWGKHDRVTPPWIGERYARLIQASQFHLLPNSRHAPHRTEVEATCLLIKHFLAS